MNNFSVFIYAAAFFLAPGPAFWPYFAGILVLAAGLAAIFRSDSGHAQATDKLIVCGRLFFAVPIAVFGADHFVATSAVANMVPSWIPGHLFWTYFVGAALIAAAFSIAIKRYAVMAASLLSWMIFSFVLLIHIPNLIAQPGNRIALVVLFRDLSFSAGALAFAVARARPPWKGVTGKITVLIRLIIGIVSVLFGVEQFVYPQLVPVIPLRQVMPSWIPAHAPLAYLTGLVLVAAGLSMIVNWKPRIAATWLGTYVFFIVLLVYVPIMLAKPSDIGNGLNYFADTLAFSGAILLVAGALPKERGAEQPLRDAERTDLPAATVEQSEMVLSADHHASK